MWGAIAGIVGLLAAGVTYWLKRSADVDPKKFAELEMSLESAQQAVMLRDRRITAYEILVSYLKTQLAKERRKNVESLDASGAADRLREPGPPSSDR